MSLGTCHCKIGCCGPPVSLARYAQTFPVVEVQQTFYQPPSLRTLENWRSKVPDSFEFTLKAWQLITHEASSPTYRRLREKLSDRERREAGSFCASSIVMRAWHRTLECALALGSRIILFQCPAHFAPTAENKENMRAFFREIDRKSPRVKDERRLIYVWEPRGAWKAPEIGELCEELGLVHGVDPFQQEPVTDGLGYFRLHGRTGNRYRYSEADFKQLLMLTQSRPSYVLFNNIAMWEDARRFQELVCSAGL